jgi:hypothetical protein
MRAYDVTRALRAEGVMVMARHDLPVMSVSVHKRLEDVWGSLHRWPSGVPGTPGYGRRDRGTEGSNEDKVWLGSDYDLMYWADPATGEIFRRELVYPADITTGEAYLRTFPAERTDLPEALAKKYDEMMALRVCESGACAVCGVERTTD